MKKILLLLLMLVFVTSVFAQEEDTAETGLRLGLTLSPQVSWMSASDNTIQGQGAYFGIAYGLLLDWSFKKNYSFSSGVLISHEGGKTITKSETQFNTYPNDTFPAATTISYRTQYIEVPIALKLKTNQIGYITYFGQFGLQGGIKIRSRADIENPNPPPASQEKVNFTNDVNLPDLGLLFGAGIEYELSGNTALLISAQFYSGFLDVTDNPGNYETKATLSHVRLQLGFYF